MIIQVILVLAYFLKTLPLFGTTYEEYLVLPFCLVGLIDFPNGCIDPSVVNRTECEMNGGTWWLPSLDQVSCTSTMGCLDVVTEIGTVGVQYAFSPKDFSNCTSSYNPTGTWTSYFTWTPARWIEGSLRKLNFLPRQPYLKNQYTYTLNFQLVQDAFFEGANVQVIKLFTCKNLIGNEPFRPL